MSFPTPLKRLILAGLRAAPWLERRVLPSSGYRLIDRDEVVDLQTTASGWKAHGSAAWQQHAYEKLIAQLESGHPRDDFCIAARAVDMAGLAAPSLLEVGCGGGYHSLVFAALCSCSPRYTGADYSEAMVASARSRFPEVRFEVADTTQLPYDAGSFDIVFDGVSLMHIEDYRRALSQIARVARSHAVLHCVPVFDDDHATQHVFKYAYGEPVTEAIYGRAEFEAAVADAGMTIIHSWNALPYDLHHVTGSLSHSRTYLCAVTAER